MHYQFYSYNTDSDFNLTFEIASPHTKPFWNDTVLEKSEAIICLLMNFY